MGRHTYAFEILDECTLLPNVVMDPLDHRLKANLLEQVLMNSRERGFWVEVANLDVDTARWELFAPFTEPVFKVPKAVRLTDPPVAPQEELDGSPERIRLFNGPLDVLLNILVTKHDRLVP